MTATVDDAVRLGCVGIGFTIYPGVDNTYEMYEELRDLAKEAQARGLCVIVWSYARGNMGKEDETALNTIAYGAHMACLLGAHIVKVKLPTDHISSAVDPVIYESIPRKTMAERVRHVVDSCFSGRRIVIFSGGQKQNMEAIYRDAQAICEGGGYGSIIGRNCFQRPYDEAFGLLQRMIGIYRTHHR